MQIRCGGALQGSVFPEARFLAFLTDDDLLVLLDFLDGGQTEIGLPRIVHVSRNTQRQQGGLVLSNFVPSLSPGARQSHFPSPSDFVALIRLENREGAASGISYSTDLPLGSSGILRIRTRIPDEEH